jgi:hypothetical protein
VATYDDNLATYCAASIKNSFGYESEWKIRPVFIYTRPALTQLLWQFHREGKRHVEYWAGLEHGDGNWIRYYNIVYGRLQ